MKENNISIRLACTILVLFLLTSCGEGKNGSAGFAEQGIKQMRQFAFDKAIRSFETAIEMEPNNANYYCHLGNAYVWYLRSHAEIVVQKDKTLKNEILNKAEHAFKKSLGLDLGQVCASEGLCDLFEYKGDYNKALSQYKRVTETDPGNRKIYRKIGEVYIALDDIELAREAFSKFLENYSASTDYDKDYQFTSTNRVSTMKGMINIRSTVKWNVVDEIIYEGTLGDIEKAETRLKDMYWAGLAQVGYRVRESSDLLSMESKVQVMGSANRLLRKNYGIEIARISEISIESNDGK